MELHGNFAKEFQKSVSFDLDLARYSLKECFCFH